MRESEVLQYRDSSDSKVAKAGMEVRTGRKWKAEGAIRQAEARLDHNRLVGVVARCRAGLGSFSTPHIDTFKGKERRCLVQEEVSSGRGGEKLQDSRNEAARCLIRWENAIERKVTWAGLWKAEPQRIKFLIQAVYDVLPSPSNLHIWGKVESPACPLWFRRGTLEHILSCCPKALGEGRYRWRHDQVLKAIAEAITAGVEWAKHSRPSMQAINFIRAGEQPRPAAKTSTDILATARDWQLLVDLEQQLKFPNHILTTTLRPDVFLLSESTKQGVLLELAVPWEDRLEEAFERKLAKYEGLVSECRQAGWRARCLPIKVGSRGFADRSLCRAFSLLGINGVRRRRAIYNTTEAAEEAVFLQLQYFIVATF